MYEITTRQKLVSKIYNHAKRYFKPLKDGGKQDTSTIYHKPICMLYERYDIPFTLAKYIVYKALFSMCNDEVIGDDLGLIHTDFKVNIKPYLWSLYSDGWLSLNGEI